MNLMLCFKNKYYSVKTICPHANLCVGPPNPFLFVDVKYEQPLYTKNQKIKENIIEITLIVFI